MATGIAELKASLSRYLEQVKAGQEVLITERGVPIAKIVPLDAPAARKSRRERLAKQGVLALGRGRMPAELRQPPRGERVGREVLDALIAERREGR